jgi:hypothetical protein
MRERAKRSAAGADSCWACGSRLDQGKLVCGNGECQAVQKPRSLRRTREAGISCDWCAPLLMGALLIGDCALVWASLLPWASGCLGLGGGFALGLCSAWCFMGLGVTFTQAVFTDPGIVISLEDGHWRSTLSASSTAGAQRCESCGVLLPRIEGAPRPTDAIIHSPHEGSCVWHLDHDCGLIGRAVGARNTLVFIRLLLYLAGASLTVVLQVASASVWGECGPSSVGLLGRWFGESALLWEAVGRRALARLGLMQFASAGGLDGLAILWLTLLSLSMVFFAGLLLFPLLLSLGRGTAGRVAVRRSRAAPSPFDLSVALNGVFVACGSTSVLECAWELFLPTLPPPRSPPSLEWKALEAGCFSLETSVAVLARGVGF